MLRPLPAVTCPELPGVANLRRTGFNAHAVVVEDTAVLHLQGELDMATAGLLRRVLDEAMAEDVTGLLLDLTDLTFVDSSGIGLFVSAARQAQVGGRSFTLRHPTPMVLKALRLTGVDHQLLVEPTGPAAN